MKTGSGNFKKKEVKKEIHPVAKLLCGVIKGQILEFLSLTPEERADGVRDLFYVGSWPAILTAEGDEQVQDVDRYAVYQLDRSARMRRENPLEMSRMSTAIVLVDKETARPAFYLTAYITPKEDANIKVIPYTDKGADYPNSLIWDSRDK